MEEIKRIEWIDYSKAFACLLVAIGHLLMSLRSIDNYSYITEFIIWFIYLFHMPLFMCMSGLLYSKNKINSFNDYKKFELKKIINLIVPYITFYSITMILNQLFSSSVNTPKGIKEWLGIFNNPIPPYWFLYALLSIFIIVPIIEKICKNKKSIVLTIFIVLKIVSLFWIPNIYFIKSIMSQGMYFYIGTFISLNKRNDNKICIVSLVITYFLLSMTVYVFEDRISAIILGSIYIVLAVAGTFITINLFKNIKKPKILNTFKNYTFQIFLMHTIFAAGVRIVLYKIGIENYIIHVIAGLIASIYLPKLVSIISNKIKYTNFFFYPLKTIEECKKG